MLTVEEEKGFRPVGQGRLTADRPGAGHLADHHTCQWYAPAGHGPNLVLVVVAYLGLFGPFVAGAVTVTLLGFIYDAAGGGSTGPQRRFVPGRLSGGRTDSSETESHCSLSTWSIFILAFALGMGLLNLLALFILDWPISLTPISHRTGRWRSSCCLPQF